MSHYYYKMGSDGILYKFCKETNSPTKANKQAKQKKVYRPVKQKSEEKATLDVSNFSMEIQPSFEEKEILAPLVDPYLLKKYPILSKTIASYPVPMCGPMKDALQQRALDGFYVKESALVFQFNQLIVLVKSKNTFVENEVGYSTTLEIDPSTYKKINVRMNTRVINDNNFANQFIISDSNKEENKNGTKYKLDLTVYDGMLMVLHDWYETTCRKFPFISVDAFIGVFYQNLDRKQSTIQYCDFMLNTADCTYHTQRELQQTPVIDKLISHSTGLVVLTGTYFETVFKKIMLPESTKITYGDFSSSFIYKNKIYYKYRSGSYIYMEIISNAFNKYGTIDKKRYVLGRRTDKIAFDLSPIFQNNEKSAISKTLFLMRNDRIYEIDLDSL